ncbi:unnamed protein product [Medioppia subpectinata]|uniref:Uncharacterized protein n=1 Tax=Medioppia subpectinata TaxID=1979941 RepID=A0A7R9PYS3_9ACAR|nr:unnamed protein product [Medioppia subpectinata]CAG2106190.1 unnamed protein product [Medioppia subpectinata]
MRDLTINTVILENFALLLPFKDRYFNGQYIKNMVLKAAIFDWVMMEPSRVARCALFDGIDAQYLEVLTILDSKLTQPLNQREEFEWKMFAKFVNLKALHIENGVLVTVGQRFRDLSVGQLISVTFRKNILQHIERHTFDAMVSLKRLTITQNLITSLDFLATKHTVWPKLWYLDLRQNLLESFPTTLVDSLPALKVLKLGQNKIRVIDANTMNVLIARCSEFHFEKLPGPIDKSGPADKDIYFEARKSMAWIPNFFQTLPKSPYFFYESLQKMKCLNMRSNETILCGKIDPDDFDFPDIVNSTTPLPNTPTPYTDITSGTVSHTTPVASTYNPTHSHTPTSQTRTSDDPSTEPSVVTNPTDPSVDWDRISYYVSSCLYYDHDQTYECCFDK